MDATMALAAVSWVWKYVFSCYIAFSVFAVPWYFVSRPSRGAERDQEMVVQSLIMDKHQLKTSLEKLFQKMDDEKSGKLSLANFEKHFQDEEVRVLFEALDIGVTDAWTLFLSLDHNEDYQIEAEEFLEGCLQLRGAAKAIDLFMLRRQVAKLMLVLSEPEETLREKTACLEADGLQMLMTGQLVDLRPLNGGFVIFNQGHLGSCTANALAAAYHFTLHKQNVENDAQFKDFTPSRLFIYYNERYVEGSVDKDAGAMIRDGIKVMEKMGVCPETVWKYDDGPDFFKKQPEKSCYEMAQKCIVKGYARVAQDLEQMKLCIKHGYPFVFGFTVLTSFSQAAKDGTMVMPQKDDQVRGGHAVTAVGYDDMKKVFIVRNSWGEGWGDKGYFYMPYEYICHPQLAQECRTGDLEPLWSCDFSASRVPKAGHPHEEAQKVLEQSLKAMCEDSGTSRLWQTFLDCDFRENYFRWTSPESDWLEEGFVTYVAGPQDSIYALQAVNLIRSIDLFSTRPVVVVVFDDKFVPPAQWHSFPNVIVYKMLPMKGRSVSFNFNKLRAMIAARVLVGIQLDTDQIIVPGLERMFAATKREIHEFYPWIMLPVHWMSRDAKRGELYSEMNFEGWKGPRTMRWGHAHPTWTYWALPFLLDLLYERFRASSKPGKIEVWDLPAASRLGLRSVLLKGLKRPREARYGSFMNEDEDMMNVGLWRDSAKKEWCKFDLEWALYKERFEVADKSMSDSKWYPDGVPLAYLSMHNTKQFEVTDWLLSWLARCVKFKPTCKDKGRAPAQNCQEDSSAERQLRRKPGEYLHHMCCCVEPRMEKWIFWGKTWFSRSADVPGMMPGMQKNRTCTLP
ncbi:unnamed protein product [Durusdinium trenchii]|uniref:EF-hand domain-containing protein n=1 Tax=Durusdinium trenchii TaxID=1381693 RepID=A0ABP0SCZ5_9DINO